MQIPTVTEILEWIEVTCPSSDTPDQVRAKFNKIFGLGTPRPILREIEQSFMMAMIARQAKLSRRNRTGG